MASPSTSTSSTTITRKRFKTQSEVALKPSFSDLPSSLLEVIMSRLVLKENIIASASCKSWCEAALSVRVVEKHPWLLSFSKRSSLFELHDPVQSKSYTLNLPELAEATVRYSSHSWLLMHASTTKDLFFFNPFTQELISLPKSTLPFQAIAFSSPPTSDNCVVVALNFKLRQHYVTISTCHPGATEWITEAFPAALLYYIRASLSISMIDSIVLPLVETPCIPFTCLPGHGFVLRMYITIINCKVGGRGEKLSWQRSKESSFSCLLVARKNQWCLNKALCNGRRCLVLSLMASQSSSVLITLRLGLIFHG
ncbi:hypothetical protein F2Q70_00009221 [Brassica cretica]|uniref:F-box domain-containing protein n=1 Tax=Brassica cretica TaxID=69181 RepID=A0A8S9JLZ8_BRACR|nr:hypothetical protein F2Q68_00002319 [Brassica cretica]KAF2614716.1 hypothetical protein F2Q70_00009221 [Brassica cretica]